MKSVDASGAVSEYGSFKAIWTAAYPLPVSISYTSSPCESNKRDVTIAWTEAVSPHCPIEEYRVYIDNVLTFEKLQAAILKVALPPLTCFKWYTVRVSTKNCRGWGEASEYDILA